MIKQERPKIANGYSKLKSVRQFDGYSVTSYASGFGKEFSSRKRTQKEGEVEDESYKRLRGRVEEIYQNQKMFRLYATISDSIMESVKEISALKKVREIECQLLKIILLNPVLPPAKEEKSYRRFLMSQNNSKQNSLPATSTPCRGVTTTNTRKRRVYQKSMMESPLISFENFRITESIKRLETEFDKIPECKIKIQQKSSLQKDPEYVQMKNEMKNLDIQSRYLNGELDVKNLRINSLIKQIQGHEESSVKLQQQIIALAVQNKTLMLQLTSYRNGLHYQELWRMASEEVESIRITKIELEREMKHLSKKYKHNKDRLNELMKNRSSGIVDEAKQDMEDVKYLIAELNQNAKPIKDDPGPTTQKQPFKLPNVFSLFEPQKLKESELNNHKNRILGFQFFLKMRGIMDSKYNQFWSNAEARNCANLADFTIGFLDKFSIDPKYKKITMNGSSSQQIERGKLQFILNLSSNKVKDVIEISLFKEFLFDQRERDELFFYLSCRHVLFNGHTLDNVISSQDPIIFVPLDRAHKVIDQILINFDRNLTDRIKQSLNLKRKKKAHKFFIDGHFLLKALLQLYSLERRKKMVIFKKALASQDPSQKEVSFKTLKKFINKNYPFVTNSEISELYRTCWKMTYGKMEVSTLFNMCDWIFIQELKDQMFLPKRFNNEFREHMQKVEVHLEEGKYFTRRILELGTEKLLYQAQRLKQAIAMKSRDCLNIQQLFGLMNSLQLPKTLKIVQILSTAGCNKLSKIPYFGQSDFNLVEFGELTEINRKNEQHRRDLKEAAEKIGIYFDSRIKILYKRFGNDINKELMEISNGLP